MVTHYLRRFPAFPRIAIVRLVIIGLCLTLGLSLSQQTAAEVRAQTAQSSVSVGNLHVDYLVNPLGIDDRQPQLSWELSSSAQNQSQQAYEVQAATTSALLSANTPNLWDSGKVTSSASTNVTYGGSALHSRQQVYWRVQVWDQSGNVSAWSSVAQWEMGLLASSDWSAHWITNPGSGALPLFAKQFTLAKAISNARLYITGLGVYDASLNGKAISKAVLQPPETDYLKRVIYTTYDVTSLLQQGANTLGVQLGNGIANVPSTSGRYEKFTATMSTPQLLAQLEVTYSDGTVARIVSDNSWRTTSGPTTFSNWFGGEDYDARLAQPGWQNPGANLSSWQAATQTTAPSSQTVLNAQMVPSIQQVGTLHPVKITQPKSGNYVFDFGTNFAGWEQLQVSGPAGTKITMTPGELLNSDGTVSQTTTGSPIYDDYILSGKGTETWHPDFMYHGFRYLQVTGLPSAPTTNTFTGLELSTVNASAGTFTSGNSMLNSINQIIDQAIQNNMYSVLTDCPHREKLGWLEEDHLVFGAVSRTYDVAAYYRELIRNMADAQISNGLVPDIAPEYIVFSGGFRDDPNWGSTLIISSWQLYQTYGDSVTLRTYYSNMQKYLTYLQSQASGNLLNYGLGDWAAIDTSTPVGVTASYAYYEDAQTMSKIASALGHTSDATTYSTLAQQIGSAFNTKYFNTTTHNTYANGTQADDALALDMGIVPTQYQSAVLQHLVGAIRSNSNHLTVGEIALPSLLRALAQGGRSDVLYDVATQTTYPSYGYMVSTGSTALTEYWDGANGTGSQDHFMLGAIKDWFSSNLGGIQADPSAVAYNKLIISPTVVGNLTQAASTYNTPYGQASSSWTKNGSIVQLQVKVPVNTTATVQMPVNPIQPTATMGQGFQSFQNGYAIYSIGSGSYTFTSDLEGGNLAFQKTVTSNNSFENSDWGVAHLTDGFETSISGAEGYTSNVFSSSNASSNAPYVDVDLGSNQSFNAVTLFPRTDAETANGDTPDFPVTFTIQVAPDGGSYKTVATITNQANPKGLAKTYSFAMTTARHVRIVVTTLGNPALNESAANYYRLQLAELEVHAVSAGPRLRLIG